MQLTAEQLDHAVQRIRDGETHRQIAADLGLGHGRLSEQLAKNAPEQSARAMLDSAEAWLDRGLEVIASSLQKSGDIDPGAARAYAQECARRAAIRNPKYRDKAQLEHTGEVRLPVVWPVRPPLVEQVPVELLPAP